MVQRRVTKGGEVRWDVRLRYPDGRQYSKTFRSKREAERYRATELADRARGNWLDPKAGEITFAAWAAEWLSAMEHSWRPRTAEKHRMAMEVHWKPRFGHQTVASMSPRLIQAAVNNMADTYAPSSVRTFYGTLRTAMKHAVERDLIGRSPCRAIRLPADRADDRRVIEPHELHRLADAMADRWRCTVYLAGVLGLRYGEVAALRVSDVDLVEGGELRVRRTLTEVGQRVEFAAPKSSASARTLVLPGPMADELAAHVELLGLVGDELFFADVNGQPIRRSRFRRRIFRPAAAAARLDGLTFHGLRHSAATRWVATGVDVRTVQAWLGHADPSLVLRLYAHASDSASRRSAEKVGRDFWRGEDEAR
ncbi:MAG: tyrosine-type recombinase/integrase [Actinomycetota bacterium]